MATSFSLKKLLASSTLLTKSRFASTFAATNNLSSVRRISPLPAYGCDPISVTRSLSKISLASPLSDGIGGGFRLGWESKRGYSVLSGLGEVAKEEVKVPVKKKKKTFTKICVVVKSREKKSWEQTYPAHENKIRLPTKRMLITVLRSPHVHKKSREQFFLTTKKEHLTIQAERHELAKKYFWLKRHRIMGAEFEVRFFCKTRLQLQRARETYGLNDGQESELQNEPAPA